MSTISITDQFDGLTVHHYTDCTLQDTDEVKQARGIIKENDVIVCKTFPFTPELRIDDPIVSEKILSEYLSTPAFQSLEGTLLRIWYRESQGEWYLSTHRKVDAFLSRWASDYSYGEYFVSTMIRSSDHIPELKGVDTFAKYASRLDPHKIYVLLLRTGKENRIVCTSQDHPTLYTVGAFLRSDNFSLQYASELPETLFPPIPKLREEFQNADQVTQYVNSIDPFDTQGIIFIKPDGSSLKLLHPTYDITQKLRGNVPNVLLRYIQLRNGSSVEDITRFQELYNDFSIEFVQFERVIREIQHNLHRKYLIRFIHHKTALVPPEQYAVLRELHQYYLANRQVITVDIIIQEMRKMSPGKLMYLYRKYTDRERDLGNGNYVTEEERQMIMKAC